MAENSQLVQFETIGFGTTAPGRIRTIHTLPSGESGHLARRGQPHPDATQDFAWINALSESNLCVPLALPVFEQLRT